MGKCAASSAKTTRWEFPASGLNSELRLTPYSFPDDVPLLDAPPEKGWKDEGNHRNDVAAEILLPIGKSIPVKDAGQLDFQS